MLRQNLLIAMIAAFFLIIISFAIPSLSTAACIDTGGDGYGNPGDASCPNGNKADCNDNDNKVYPGAA
ncbi:MAG: hypothetical protein HY758_07770, partial [Nitrospirae bacterium]|nr:hypothetical protein [Nitrospirota bacterium]